MTSKFARERTKREQASPNQIRKEKKNANAIGFQKRKAKRPEKTSNGLDVYEFDEKDRRGRIRAEVTLDLTKEEAKEYGSDSESGKDDFQKMRDKIKMDEDGIINSEDDEDIDSDDAFDESDEERFASFNFKSKPSSSRSKAKISSQQEVNLDEDDDQTDDSVEEEEDTEEHEATEEGTESGEEHQSSRGALADEGDLMPSDDEGENADALEALESYITKAISKSVPEKRKLDEMENAVMEPPRQKRRIIKEQTQAGPEGEFAPSRQSQNKLQLNDLIAPLSADGPSGSAIGISAAAKALNSSKATPLAAPLPTRIQDRVDRKAAYEQTKAEVQKWEPTMRRIREAKPMHQGNLATLSAHLKPSTELESAVDRLLKAAELRDEDIKKTEELQMQHLTIEEIAERQAELRRKRDLIFRAEIKAKRVAKIKSKTYRKIQKKERAKQAERLKAMGMDVDEDEERLRAEADRAKERATLKHKNAGKWASSMRSKNELDEDQRRDMQEMYNRGEKLRKKIAGQDSEAENDYNPSDDDNETMDDVAAHAMRALRDIDQDDPGASVGGKGGLMEMKFMKEAARRDEAHIRMEMDSFREELHKLGMDEDDDDAPPKLNSGSNGIIRRGGRVTANPVALRTREPETIETNPEGDERENPWLALESGTSSKISRAKNSITVAKNSNAATLSKHSMKKQLLKHADTVTQARDDAQLEIDLNTVMTLPETNRFASKSTKSKETGSIHRVDPESGDEDDDSDEERENEKSQRKGRRNVTFEQRELVAKAFSGDNVVEEFASEKRREMEADAPKEVDTTLPGWGSWGGAGITKVAPKPERIKRFPGINPKKRQDYEKDHVIISEKKDKKAEKYQVKDLPFPYTSKAQFDRRFEVPLGMEWNTRATFQKATLPRVVKKMGTIIEPLEKLF